MIRAIIADDEPAAGIIIRHLVQKSKMPIEIIGTGTDGQMTLDMIRSKNPELIFLDIFSISPNSSSFQTESKLAFLQEIVIKSCIKVHKV